MPSAHISLLFGGGLHCLLLHSSPIHIAFLPADAPLMNLMCALPWMSVLIKCDLALLVSRVSKLHQWCCGMDIFLLPFPLPPKLLCSIHIAVSTCCNGSNSGMDLVLLMNSATSSLPMASSSASSPLDPRPPRGPSPILCPQNMLQLWVFTHLLHPRPPSRFLLLRALWGETNLVDCLEDWNFLLVFIKILSLFTHSHWRYLLIGPYRLTPGIELFLYILLSSLRVFLTRITFLIFCSPYGPSLASNCSPWKSNSFDWTLSAE